MCITLQSSDACLLKIDSRITERSKVLSCMVQSPNITGVETTNCLVPFTAQCLRDWRDGFDADPTLSRVIAAAQAAAFFNDEACVDEMASLVWQIVHPSWALETLLGQLPPEFVDQIYEQHPVATSNSELQCKLVDRDLPLRSVIGAIKHSSCKCEYGGLMLSIASTWDSRACEAVFACRPHLDAIVSGISATLTCPRSTLIHDIASMTQIRYLDLKLTLPRFPLPTCMSRLTSLDTLLIQGPSFTQLASPQDIPHAFGTESVMSLTSLQLAAMNIDEGAIGSIKEWISTMSVLEKLDLSRSCVWGGVDNLVLPVKSLRSLTLHRLSVRGFAPTQLSSLSLLRDLDVSGIWRIQNWQPLRALTALRSLSFSDCDLGDRDAGVDTILSNLVSLQMLNLSGNRLSPELLLSYISSLRCKHALTSLDISRQRPPPSWWILGSASTSYDSCTPQHWSDLIIELGTLPRLVTLDMDTMPLVAQCKRVRATQ